MHLPAGSFLLPALGAAAVTGQAAAMEAKKELLPRPLLWVMKQVPQIAERTCGQQLVTESVRPAGQQAVATWHKTPCSGGRRWNTNEGLHSGHIMSSSGITVHWWIGSRCHHETPRSICHSNCGVLL